MELPDNQPDTAFTAFEQSRLTLCQLTNTDYEVWFKNLTLIAVLNKCKHFLPSDPPKPDDAAGKKKHKTNSTYTLALIVQSLSEEVRTRITSEDVSRTPNSLCSRLKTLTSTSPANASYILSSLAGDTVLRPGISISE